jgi:hypothetical protein
MRNLFRPRLEQVGTVTVGINHYWVQRYYPNGGDNYCVYVYRKGAPQQRGMVFEDEEHFFDWAENAPRQMALDL